MPINHVALPTTPRTHTRMRAFYQTILSPLGYTIYKEQANLYVGFRPRNGGPDFWLHSTCEEVAAQLERDGYLFNSSKDKEEGKKGLTTHVAFDAGGVKEVERWYKIAVYVLPLPPPPSPKKKSAESRSSCGIAIRRVDRPKKTMQYH